MIMAILVLGGAGYIGSHTVYELIDAGRDVVVADNLCNSCEEALNRVKELTGKDLTFYKADMLDKEGLDQMFDKERSTGGSLGTITDIQVSGGTYEGKLNDGTVAMLPAEDCYNILLTIEGEALIEGNGSVMLNRIYSLGVNSNRNFNTKYANFVGTIVDLQIPGGDQ